MTTKGKNLKRIKIYIKVRKIFQKYKKIILLVSGIILLLLIPPIVNMLISTKAFFLPNFLGFIDSENESAWISFYGSLIGGVITVIGVILTINEQNKKYHEEIKDSIRPILIADTYKEVGIKNDGNNKIYECILSCKNMGKSALFNPNIYNIECTLKGIKVDVSPNIPLISYLKENGLIEYDIMVHLTHENLEKVYLALPGKGFISSIIINMFIGGLDLYGRNIITKLTYECEITFDSPDQIETNILMRHHYTSQAIINKNEIEEILENKNITYMNI